MITLIYILGVVIAFILFCIADRTGKLILVSPDFGEGIFMFIFSLMWPLVLVILIKYYLREKLIQRKNNYYNKLRRGM